ncbi:MAG TPA: 2-isopropylmalate synthase, partial [Syntrophorhabdales bacterium]|nr:2-isopropylmalate synthase [Syntrophorhabdales bacterium]
SKTEFAFLRLLIEEGLIPDDVTIQVLTQAREHLIKKTFEAIRGARRVIVHLYNSTSELQRRVVFRKDREGIIRLAVAGARIIRAEAERLVGTEVFYEYSPESFTGTELDFAMDVFDAVATVWEPGPGHKMILNLPATVEMSTPNVYADRIEWFSTHLEGREAVTLSVHPHNDRGCAVAAAELALMAGAERVEGTLFGNGERTGNADIVTLALNLFSQGVDPGLDLHDITGIMGTFERCMKIPVHLRHPYAGELVYTAFSGSHQDAIRKGMKAYAETEQRHWEVPYLPIDPSDVGRSYESIIRINSQSGKGGIAYVMEKEYGMVLPKEMHPELADLVQRLSEEKGKEIRPETIWEVFERNYLAKEESLSLRRSTIGGDDADGAQQVSVEAVVLVDRIERTIRGAGNGPIDAFVHALREAGFALRITSYSEHALSTGSDSKAAAYVQVEWPEGVVTWGVGIDNSIHLASFKAILSGLSRAIKGRAKRQHGSA